MQDPNNNILIVGLGNPGNQYSNTRHNTGFIAIDYLISHFNFTPQSNKKFDAILAKGERSIDDDSIKYNIILAKPMTYMNLSGKAVAAIARFYKIDLNNILVIHDDVDLEVGRIKIKQGGSSAGHNGLKSIDQHIGSNYWRIRIGVGKSDYGDLATYVLSKFSKQEHTEIMLSISKFVDALPLLYTHQIEKFKISISKP